MAAGAITPTAALQAYRAMQQVGDASGGATATASGDFSAVLTNALQSVADQGAQAETQAKSAIGGHGNLLDVVTAVSRAELSLQTTIAVRDRVVQAYQDIMHMAI